MDAAEALAGIRGGAGLGLRLGQAAQSAGAHPLAAFEAGRSVEKLFEAFATPLVVLDTPGSSAWATEGGIASFSGQDVALAVQGDLHQSAAHTWSSVSGKTTSWYVHAGGVKAFAANGAVSLRAHTDALQILADQSVTVISVNDEIRISASTKIELVAGQSLITLEGANIEFKTPGAFTVKGSGHAFLGGGSGAAELTALPVGISAFALNTIHLDHRYHDNEGLAGAAFVATFSDGQTRTGTLDGGGRATLANTPSPTASVAFGPAAKPFERKERKAMPNHDEQPSSSKLQSLVDRYASDLAKSTSGTNTVLLDKITRRTCW